MSTKPGPNVEAQAFADGTVRLRWKRGGNAPGTSFAIETSADGANWSYLPSVTRTSLALEGFDPGVAAWFRVRATNATMISAPSSTASVYAPTLPAAVKLRLAA